MRYLSKQNTGVITLLALLLAITGCNSDSSSETSSGGGGGSATTTESTSTPVSPASIAGTYRGTATATASALGITESETVPVTIIIDENGSITVQSGSDIFPDVITLNGNSFSTSQTFVNEKFGSATCSGTLSLQGSVDNSGKLAATLTSQSVSCNNIPGFVTGTLIATR